MGVFAILLSCFLWNAPRFGWRTDCEWHSAAALPGYSAALLAYRSWLSDNLFRECDVPGFAKRDAPHAETKWYQSQKYPEVFVVTSGDLQCVRANIVVSVQDPLFSFRATQKELKTYTDEVSEKLHNLWNPNMRTK
jgi:hypothetical protein